MRDRKTGGYSLGSRVCFPSYLRHPCSDNADQQQCLPTASACFIILTLCRPEMQQLTMQQQCSKFLGCASTQRLVYQS